MKNFYNYYEFLVDTTERRDLKGILVPFKEGVIGLESALLILKNHGFPL